MKLERERKTVTVGDALALSWVLSTAPRYVLVPTTVTHPSRSTASIALDPTTARTWVRGNPMANMFIEDARTCGLQHRGPKMRTSGLPGTAASRSTSICDIST